MFNEGHHLWGGLFLQLIIFQELRLQEILRAMENSFSHKFHSSRWLQQGTIGKLGATVKTMLQLTQPQLLSPATQPTVFSRF
jgi:hypothetical protein